MKITETLNARIQEILIYYGVHDTFGADDTAEIATRIEKELKLEIKKAYQRGLNDAKKTWVKRLRNEVKINHKRGHDEAVEKAIAICEDITRERFGVKGGVCSSELTALRKLLNPKTK